MKNRQILCVTQSFWDEPYREKKILMERLSADNRVVWVSRFGRPGEPLTPRVEQINPNLAVYYPGCKYIPDRYVRSLNDIRRLGQVKGLLRKLKFKPDIVWIHDHYARRFSEHFKGAGALSLYYCNDNFGEGRDKAEELKLAKSVDFILTTSPNLQERFAHTGRSHLIYHGVEEFTPFDFPYAKGELKTAGYVGTIRYCLDLELLRRIAGGGRCRLVMAGPIIEMENLSGEQRQEWADFLESPGVDYLGPLERAGLRQAMAGIDVLLLPYDCRVKSELSFPQKVFEYLSVGRPVVSTDFFDWPPEFARYIRVCRDGDEINAAVEAAHAAHDRAHYEAAIGFAHQNTWTRKLRQISELIGRYKI